MEHKVQSCFFVLAMFLVLFPIFYIRLGFGKIERKMRSLGADEQDIDSLYKTVGYNLGTSYMILFICVVAFSDLLPRP